MSSQRLTDLMQSTASESDIRFYFITKSGTIDEASEDLTYSFQIIADFASTTENLQWLSEDDCLSLDAPTLTKESVFVMEEFTGAAFDHLSTTKAIVIGPRVLINCQLSNDVVPNISSPIFTLAMKNVTVCVSGIDAEKRAEIHRLVGFMGGLSSKDLTESTTHLITNTVKSPKYEKAGLKNMKIMNEEWVFNVWSLSKKDDASYTTDEFYQKHKFPIFHNLVVTSTGITEADKNEIIRLISENGGTYHGSFKSKFTDILITQPNQRNSEKFKAAVKCRKECLLVDWIKDSVAKGYALPYVNYRIYTGQSTREKVMNSTQVADRSTRSVVFNPDASQLSAIISDVSIAETTSQLTPMKKSPAAKRSDYKAMLDNMDLSVVKSAKGCLDGCTIWLCGFDGTDIDKLKKIVNIGGGTRIDDHGPDVEYAIVGKPNSVDLTNLKSMESSNIVTMDWLVACINTKRVADPKDFLYKLQASHADSTQTVPSPASRKNIEDMNPFRRPVYVPRKLHMNEDDEQIKKRTEKTLLEQYSQASPIEPANVQREETTVGAETADESEQIDPNLFRGMTFALYGFSEESTLELTIEIDEAGGRTIVMNDFSEMVDYLVVPGDTNDISGCEYKAKEMVNDLWIQQCLGENTNVAIEYYHRPILSKPECKPLQGLKIVFSSYTGAEREYLYFLAQALGAEVNDRYMRNQSPILICPTPEGKKYLGAVKWKLPVVNCEWLKKCLEMETRISMQNFMVGESKCEDEENMVDQETQRFEKKPDDNRKLSGSDDGVKVHATPPVTPSVPSAQHPRIASIKSVGGRRSPQSPATPLRSNAMGEEKSPTTAFVEDLTPISRKIVYDLYKASEADESPLTKRRRLEKVSDSPFDMRLLDPPDIFEIIDQNFVEPPQRRRSTPFAEYRKRIYKASLGDKYDSSPLSARGPASTPENAQAAPRQTTTPQSTAVPNVEACESSTKDPGEKKASDGSTQVMEFFNSIKKCRDSRPSRINSQQISKLKLNDSASDSGEDEPPKEPPQQPQVEEIDWRDPEDFFQSERFLNGSRSTFKGAMRFGMSSAIDTELKEKIETLGGSVCEDSTSFDPKCTHLICSKPNMSEKTLSIIAAGRWLLCPAYVTDSFKAGHFLNEEEYEWGNPKAKPNLPGELDSKSNKIALVGHKWRKELQLKSKIENRPVGIFSGFRAIIHANRKDSFKRLLEAGCGVVVDISEPYTQQEAFEGVTHCFVDKRTSSIPETEKAALKMAGVHLVTILYLQACVNEDKMPSVKDYLVQ